MVLNLLRVEEVNPEFMMERSFHQFQNYSNIPKLYQNAKELEQKVASISLEDEKEVMGYYNLREQLSNLSKQFQSWLVKPQYLVPFLQPGRLVSVKHGDKDFDFGVVISFKKKSPKVPFIYYVSTFILSLGLYHLLFALETTDYGRPEKK